MVINETEDMPCAAVYAHRFGSLVRAYQLVGYKPDRDYSYVEINRALRRMHPDVMRQIEGQIASLGGTVQRDVATDVLIVNGEFTVSIVLSRCH